MSLDFNVGLSDPFYDGGGEDTSAYDRGYPVAIAGRGFEIDWDPPGYSNAFSRKGVQLLNTQQASSGGDTASISPEVWRRSVESWHQGSDQQRYDREDSLPFQYQRSMNVDPWNKYGITLLHEVARITTVGSKPFLVSFGSTLLVIDGRICYTYTDPLAAPSATTPFGTNPATTVSVASDGEKVYALMTDGTVYVRAVAGTWSLFFTEASPVTGRMMLAFVKGNLLMGNGAALNNISSGSATLVYTHPMSGWQWRAATDGLAFIYLLGGIGDSWHVYRMGVNSSTAALLPPIHAASLPDGEVGYAIGCYLGYVLIGTKNGWRFATADGAGNLTYGQLIPTAGPVQCFEGQGRFVWFGLSLQVGDVGTASTRARTVYSEHGGLGRADLSTFTAPLTPAHAPDLSSPVGETVAVVSLGSTYDGLGLRAFAIAGDGVYVEVQSHCDQGYLEQGELTFSSTDPKMGLYAQVFHDPLPGGSVELQASVDGAAFTSLANNTRINSTGLGNVPFATKFSNTSLRVNLTASDDGLVSPVVTRLELRAMNIPGAATEWMIPLLVAETTVGNGVTAGRNVVSDYDFLVDLARSRRQFVYREGARTWNLYATDFTWYARKTTADGTAFEGTMVLVAREIT